MVTRYAIERRAKELDPFAWAGVQHFQSRASIKVFNKRRRKAREQAKAELATEALAENESEKARVRELLDQERE